MKYWTQKENLIYQGHVLDVLKELPEASVHVCVTSPPYWGLRDYGIEPEIWDDPGNCEHVWGGEEITITSHEPSTHFTLEGGKGPRQATAESVSQFCQLCGAWRGCLGLEPRIDLYVAHLVQIFREVRRVLHPSGCVFLNLGDGYSAASTHGGKDKLGPLDSKARLKGFKDKTRMFSDGLKPKDLCGIPWAIAFALRDDGWWLRSDIIWCLSGGTHLYVKTQKGESPMMIKDMVRLNPKTVKLWNGKEWVQVLGHSKSKRKGDEIELLLRSGERISCTPNHQFPTQRGLLKAEQIQTGDVLDSVYLPPPSDDHYNPQYITSDMAWFIGIYLAEGSRSGSALQIASHTKETKRWDRIQKIAKHYGGSATRTIHGNNMSIRVYGQVIHAIIKQYVSGKTAKDKGLNNICWRHDNYFLTDLLQGYLQGDGHWDASNERWRIGFTRNYNLERDLRVLAARLCFKLKLSLSTSTCQTGTFPSFKGEIRFIVKNHWNTKMTSEVVGIKKARARWFYDIGVDSADHLFALASGVLTHNSKPSPMPESVTDRPTKSHEYIFLLTKNQNYFYDNEAIKEPSTYGPGCGWEDAGHEIAAKTAKSANPAFRAIKSSRNKRTVWEIATQPFTGWTRTSHLDHVEPDAVSGGMKHIVSPYCPVHEDLFAEVSSLFCGGHASDWLSYIFDTCNCLVPKPESDYVPTDHFLEVEKRLENLGWLLDKYFPSAIEHNKEIRKKALSLLTNPSCSSFDKIVSHIADKSEKFLFFVLQMSIHESNTWLDGSDAHLLDQIPYHTVDKFSLSVPPDCLCQYYQIITKESSHFATFPRKLVEPCILAGSSEYGCCPECGAPWERVVEKSNPTKQNAGGKLQQLKESGYRNDGNVRMGDPVSKTIDWRPTCNCLSDDTTQGSYYDPGGGVGIPFDPEPCTVCDIFGGSGTTGLEAERLGRKWILIEKSPEYIEMAKRRLQEQISDPEYWEREAERIEVDTGQMSMF